MLRVASPTVIPPFRTIIRSFPHLFEIWGTPKTDVGHLAVQASTCTPAHRAQAAMNGAQTRLSGPPGRDLEVKTMGYDTNNDTKLSREMEGMPQVVESLVELSGIEPLASSLRTRRSPS